MDSDLGLRDRLERSIGAPPDGPDPLGGVLAQGQRAVRRRRVLGGVASAAAVLVVAGGVVLATSGGSERAAAPPVADAPPAQTATELPIPESLVSWDPNCDLVVDPSASVVEQVDNPYGVSPPAAAAALVVRDGAGATTWWAAYCSERGSAALLTSPEKAGGTFESWIASQADVVESVEGPRPPAGPPQGQPADGLVRFVGDTEQLAARGGAEVLEQRAGVDVGADFAGPGDRTAVARVRTAKGNEVFVLVRAFAGEGSQAISVPVGSAAGSDLDAFLEFARAAYAGGGGLL